MQISIKRKDLAKAIKTLSYIGSNLDIGVRPEENRIVFFYKHGDIHIEAIAPATIEGSPKPFGFNLMGIDAILARFKDEKEFSFSVDEQALVKISEESFSLTTPETEFQSVEPIKVEDFEMITQIKGSVLSTGIKKIAPSLDKKGPEILRVVTLRGSETLKVSGFSAYITQEFETYTPTTLKGSIAFDLEIPIKNIFSSTSLTDIYEGEEFLVFKDDKTSLKIKKRKEMEYPSVSDVPVDEEIGHLVIAADVVKKDILSAPRVGENNNPLEFLMGLNQENLEIEYLDKTKKNDVQISVSANGNLPEKIIIQGFFIKSGLYENEIKFTFYENRIMKMQSANLTSIGSWYLPEEKIQEKPEENEDEEIKEEKGEEDEGK